MSNCFSKNFGLLDGQTYIIGREGDVYIEDHIYINTPLSADLCDLDSVNGTYLIENDNLLVPFKEGYVSPCQPIAIGHVKCTIKSLLEISGVYSASKNTTSSSEDTLLMPPNQ